MRYALPMPMKIVYVDDEPDLCEMFADFFHSPETVVTTFSDPELAVALGNDVPKVLVTRNMTVKTEYPFVKHFSKPYTRAEIMGRKA